MLQILGILFFLNLSQGCLHTLIQRAAFHRLEFEDERNIFGFVTRLKHHVAAPPVSFPICSITSKYLR